MTNFFFPVQTIMNRATNGVMLGLVMFGLLACEGSNDADDDGAVQTPAESSDSEPAQEISGDEGPASDVGQPIDLPQRHSFNGMWFNLPDGWMVMAGPPAELHLIDVPVGSANAELYVNGPLFDPGRYIEGEGPFDENAVFTHFLTRGADIVALSSEDERVIDDYEHFLVGDGTGVWVEGADAEADRARLFVMVWRGESPGQQEFWTFRINATSVQMQEIAPAVRAMLESVQFRD